MKPLLINHNLFRFQHYDTVFLAIYPDGRTYPAVLFQPDLEWNNGQYLPK